MKLKLHSNKKKHKEIGLTGFGSIQFFLKELPSINSKLGLTAVLAEDIIPGRISRGEGHLIHDQIMGSDNLPVRIFHDKGKYYHYSSREEEKNNGDRTYINTSYAVDHFFNGNDYCIVEIDGENYPIDYLIAPFVKFLNDNGIKTLGSDQGDSEVEEHIFVTFDIEYVDKFKTLMDHYEIVMEE